MQTRVVRSLERVRPAPHAEVRQMRDFVNVVIADVGNVVLVARHLRHAFPHLFHFEIVNAREKYRSTGTSVGPGSSGESALRIGRKA